MLDNIMLIAGVALGFFVMWFANKQIPENKSKNKNEKIYKIAFCNDCDITTKFGEESKSYPTYESAKNAIFSKAAGWGNAIQEINGDNAKIDGAWLIIFEKDA